MLNLDDLVNLLNLEELDHCLYRGQNFMTPWKRVFGGQVLGQALNAAYKTIPDDRIAHSLHSYFILGGDTAKPIIYEVDTLRDGGSFSTRRVTAIQNGKAIFVMAASFQVKQDGVSHQNDMPDVEGPDTLLTDIEQAEQFKNLVPEVYQKFQNRKQEAIQFKPVENILLSQDEAGKKLRNVWMKTLTEKTLDIATQQQLLAFASDYDLLLSAVWPHRKELDINKLFIASLDHAMWFHRHFDFRDWLLYSIDSPSASNSRGMGLGRIFDRNGRLVSTVMQEGLIRASRAK